MRGNNRKLWAVGALASAALLFTGCKSDSRDPDEIPRIRVGGGKYGPVGAYPDNANNAQTGAGHSGDVSGTGGSGPIRGDEAVQQPEHEAQEPGVEAGTGGSGSQSTGTMGQGVTGSEQLKETHTPSGGVPASGD
ncbi:hypothetical protein [Archangium primigenium]|uniref:hypothetical protein n=1 Tax=[Archangium] primigenium TaxID=2792470 RepID=UPI00195A530A|nr:hypothetical protein [Archangium primigenium]MBM7113313.1 hypothetical protein [Archangium primigenium]